MTLYTQIVNSFSHIFLYEVTNVIPITRVDSTLCNHLSENFPKSRSNVLLYDSNASQRPVGFSPSEASPVELKKSSKSQKKKKKSSLHKNLYTGGVQ